MPPDLTPDATPQPPATRAVGWLEWAGLPDWRITRLRAKIDTGAKSSSLHVSDMETYEKNGVLRVRFRVHPRQKHDDPNVAVDTEVLEERGVRSSNGEIEHRVVVSTRLALGQLKPYPIVVTLTDRSNMQFRMLVGRQALADRWLVDSGGRHLQGRPPRYSKNGLRIKSPPA